MKTFAHHWFDEVWNKGNADAIDRLFAPDAIAHGLTNPTGGPVRGPASFKPFHRSFCRAFPDIHVEVADAVTEGDMIAARCRVKGTHLGDGLGVPPSGRHVDFTGMAFMRVRNGRIVEAWNNFDFETMRAQIETRQNKA
ncbi:MAG: ester cyclase [Nevskia sp.]|nr:ester cyclase [Nevskia sp.]